MSALDGTAVYAVRGGRVSIDEENITVIEVEGEREHGYWHVVPAVQDGSRVRRGALLGHISAGGGTCILRSGAAMPRNPLRDGALTPYEDYGAPVVSRIVASGELDALAGDVDLVVEAFDHPPLSAPQPAWHGMPVAPALVPGGSSERSPVVPWRVVFDFRKSFVPKIAGKPASDVNFDKRTRLARARTIRTSQASSGSGWPNASTRPRSRTATTGWTSRPPTFAATPPAGISSSRSSTVRSDAAASARRPAHPDDPRSPRLAVRTHAPAHSPLPRLDEKTAREAVVVLPSGWGRAGNRIGCRS